MQLLKFILNFRWKERFFILTKDYMHCFKKDSSKITEMGVFLFKVSLVAFIFESLSGTKETFHGLTKGSLQN